MSEQRVSGIRCAAILATTDSRTERDLALDLRDARALLASVRPVVKAAVAMAMQLNNDDDWEADGGDKDSRTIDVVTTAVDALPESVRKEYGTPPIDWDAPVEPPAPMKDGAE